MRIEASAGRRRNVGIDRHVERYTLRADNDEEAAALARLYEAVQRIGVDGVVAVVEEASEVDP